MPKITPQELIDYTDFDEVKSRVTTKLAYDIMEAEAEIDGQLGHDFSDTTAYPTGVPDDAKIAYLKLAQFYALVNSDAAVVKGYSGEKIGDYSYTYKGESVRKPDVSHIVQKYVLRNKVSKRVNFRMSSL